MDGRRGKGGVDRRRGKGEVWMDIEGRVGCV